MAITIPEMEQALRNHYGFFKLAATELGISHGYLSKRVKASAKLRKVIEEENARFVTDAAAALDASFGLVSIAARVLGIPYLSFTQKIHEFPELSDIRSSMEEIRLDNAELRLQQNIEAKNQKAIEFFLERKGKARGYGRDPESTAEDTDESTQLTVPDTVSPSDWAEFVRENTSDE